MTDDAPPDVCPPQPVTQAPFTEWLCSGLFFDCCLYPGTSPETHTWDQTWCKVTEPSP